LTRKANEENDTGSLWIRIMYSIFFIILILISILIIGILANHAISHDKERMEERRREYSRYRAVFEEDIRKGRQKEDGDKNNGEHSSSG
jgi:ferric iron reductase protein FhuF